MTETCRPQDDAQLADLIAWAGDQRQPLDLTGHGSKRAIGHPVDGALTVDMTAFSGIVDYAPRELVMTAKAGTPVAEVRAALAEAGQHFAFEPIDYGGLLGHADAAAGTLAGVVCGNLAGPRRISVGAARDHLLGVKGVGGTGVPFKAGGRVVKNVTGFDLTKLMAGSWGTLAALTEVTFKVLPRPEKSRTVLLFGLDDAGAVRAMTQALQSRHEVSAAAHLPAGIAARSGVDMVRGAGAAVTAIRVEGPGPSVTYRCDALRNELGNEGPTEELHSARSRALWDEVRTVRPLWEPRDRLVWRLSVPPASGAAVVDRLRHSLDGEVLYDWSGGLIWLAIAPRDDAAAEKVRGAVAHVAGGHATLIRAPEDVRRRVPVFQPQAPGLAALSRRVKENLDPAGVLGPGRMGGGQ